MYDENGPLESQRTGSVYKVELDGRNLLSKIKVLATNSCFVFLITAGFFRFWAGYALGFLSASFFEHRWPDHTS